MMKNVLACPAQKCMLAIRVFITGILVSLEGVMAETDKEDQPEGPGVLRPRRDPRYAAGYKRGDGESPHEQVFAAPPKRDLRQHLRASLDLDKKK